MLRWVLLVSVSVCLAETPRDVELGRAVFRIYCAQCHGMRAQGGRAPDLTRGVSGSDEDLLRTISRGVPAAGMPSFSEMGEDSIRRVIAWLRSIDKRETEPVPGDAARGETVFWGKGQCGQCHAVGRRGSHLGPELTQIGRRRSLAFLRESVVAPGAEITDGYATVRVVNSDGSVVTGIEKSLDNFTAQLVDLSGRFYTFDRDGVKSISRERRSLMPDNYARTFTGEELTDLLAYLATLRAGDNTP